MNRYRYRIYYEGGSTKNEPHRSTKTEQELVEDLRILPEHLEHYFDSETHIKAQETEMHPVSGLSRVVTISTLSGEQAVDECLVRGLTGLELLGEKVV